jgi:DNA-binding transcriptional MerR regulator
VVRVTHDEHRSLIRVGDLASAAGLTVRALHHYEEIGLLSPSARTAAGHRLYHPETVERLYRITRLRRLGLSLDQIGRALDDPNWNLAGALRHHVSSVDTQITALTALRAGVTAVLADVVAATDPTSDLLELITTMSTLDSPLRRRISILVYRDLPAARVPDRPHPSTSLAPSFRRPAARAVPSAQTARVRRQPAATLTTSVQSATSHCPSLFQPVASTVPSLRSPTVWDCPVFEAVCTLPAATATTSVQASTQRSSEFARPVLSSEPSKMTPTECRRPAAIRAWKLGEAILRSSQELRPATINLAVVVIPGPAHTLVNGRPLTVH